LEEEDLKIVYRDPYVLDLFHLKDVFIRYSGWFPEVPPFLRTV